ncbi:iron complex transport system permease protein [Dietzia kunjamensis]|uniref:FecCD family ABC transporter permease n=2 Tax=Dietzia kunjamensis TaxID=322509 RepID=UPI000E762F09|nr:iron ABC transporter permease [Dietzia kunjamensis]RKE59836.1 iron complex transport system permease protein [Dietzia kunjamensis]
MTTPATSTADPPALPAGGSAGGSAVPAVPTVQRRHRVVIGTVASSTLLVAGVALSLFVGARSVDPTVVWSVLAALPSQVFAGDLTATLAPGSGTGMAEVVVAARVPRTITAILVGAALAVAGAGLQGATRNPLGDPGLLGLTAGAALGVVLGLALAPAAGPSAVALFAVAGSLAAGMVVVGAGRLGADSGTGLVLAGAAVTAGCTAVTSSLVIALPGVLDRFRFWGLGSVARASAPEIGAAAPFILLGLVLVLAGAATLDALALGDDLARGLGVGPVVGRAVVLAGVVILSGVATALAGPIAFLGLLVPHLLRRLVGVGNRVVLGLSVIVGPVVLLFADTVGRVVAPPGEIAVGVMTVAIGVPFLIALLRANRGVGGS